MLIETESTAVRSQAMKVQIAVSHLAKFYEVHQKEPGFVGSLRAFFARKYETVRAVEDVSFEIEQGEISVDELAEKVKRATQLIRICKAKLTSTEEDVNSILKELNSGRAKEEEI